MLRYIKSNKISKPILAANLGMTTHTLYNILSGRVNMQLDDFLRICKAIAVDPRGFITVEGVEETETEEMRIENLD